MTLWHTCDGDRHIRSIAGLLYRLVESQEQVATLGYVDTLAEQSLLEQMLDEVKPPYPQNTEALHYLLRTPFRYPPLPWGSRFGQRHEPGIFYGSREITTVLAESAYYRFVFWHSMESASPKSVIRSEHTLFSAKYHSDRGVQLQAVPFDEFRDILRHPTNFTPMQKLGADMRAAGVEAFEYISARDPQQGICAGLFTPSAFSQNEPLSANQWLCELSAEEVAFKQIGEPQVLRFAVSLFSADGKINWPAN